MHVFLLVGLILGGNGDVLVGGDRENWGDVGTGADSVAVGGGGLGAYALCSHTVVSEGFRIGSVGTL